MPTALVSSLRKDVGHLHCLPRRNAASAASSAWNGTSRLEVLDVERAEGGLRGKFRQVGSVRGWSLIP